MTGIPLRAPKWDPDPTGGSPQGVAGRGPRTCGAGRCPPGRGSSPGDSHTGGRISRGCDAAWTACACVRPQTGQPRISRARPTSRATRSRLPAGKQVHTRMAKCPVGHPPRTFGRGPQGRPGTKRSPTSPAARFTCAPGARGATLHADAPADTLHRWGMTMPRMLDHIRQRTPPTISPAPGKNPAGPDIRARPCTPRQTTVSPSRTDVAPSTRVPDGMCPNSPPGVCRNGGTVASLQEAGRHRRKRMRRHGGTRWPCSTWWIERRPAPR